MQAQKAYLDLERLHSSDKAVAPLYVLQEADDGAGCSSLLFCFLPLVQTAQGQQLPVGLQRLAGPPSF